jgi:hypothetical protein
MTSIYIWTSAARLSVMWLQWTDQGWKWIDPLDGNA